MHKKLALFGVLLFTASLYAQGPSEEGPSVLSGTFYKAETYRITGRTELAMELYETNNTDAMYLAGIVADGKSMSKKELNDWCRAASWHMIAEYTIPGVAHENPHAKALALKWIKSKKFITI